MSVTITTVRSEIKKVVDPVKASLATLVTSVSGVRSSLTALTTRVGQVEGRVDQHDQLHAAHTAVINALGESLSEMGELLEQLLDDDDEPTEPVEWSWESIQAAIDAADPGDVILVPPGVYRETVHLNKAVVLKGSPGAVISGQGTREYGVVITADNAILDGFEVCNGSTPMHHGLVQVHGCAGVIVRNCRIHTTPGACLSIQQAGATVLNCEFYGSAYLGVHGWQANGSRFENCRIHDNNPSAQNTGFEAGGLKMSETTDLVITACEVGHNGGSGVWADINCADWVIQGCRIHDNFSSGVHFEVSRGLTARGDVLYGNGHGTPGWNEGAAIRIANSRDCLLEGNLAAWNSDGLSVSMQHRTDHPGHQDVVNNRLIGNTVIVANPDGIHHTHGIAFVNDTDIGTRSWEHRQNRFYHAHPDGPWACGGPDPEGWTSNHLFTTWEPSGTLLTRQAAETLLVEAGIPISWEAWY